MKLISAITIQGFRSIRSANLNTVEPFTAFAGLNNSGKSNVLRALNAFFNGETEHGRRLDVDNDFYRPDLKAKKRKRISIGVTFSLPSNFTFRHGLEEVHKLLKNGPFEIRKEWRRGEPQHRYFLNGVESDADEREKLDQFLQLINFRYIPNRVLPLDAIRNEHQALRDVLIRRLGKKGGAPEKAFAAIRDTSEKMVGALVGRFQQICPEEGNVRLATPQSWSDLAFAFGYRLAHGDYEIEDSAQGSGIQSLLMFETLYLIDRDYFQKFGWRQAAVWAVEEPESSLHSSLEAHVAYFLQSISADPNGRLQIFSTTHSDLVIQYADRTIIAKRSGEESLFETPDDAKSALTTLSRSGVSRWVHPILHHQLEPLLLVEGEADYEFLLQAFRIIRPSRRVEIIFLGELTDGDKSGGVEDMRKYVREHAAAIKSRRPDCPVIVILDWDASEKESGFKKGFGADDPYKVMTWPEAEANPLLGGSFRGVERFYSNRIVELAIAQGASIAKKADGTCIVTPTEYNAQVKPTLRILVRKGLQSDDLKYAKPFVERVLGAAGAQ